MNHADQTALWTVCEGRWRRLVGRWHMIRLRRADWEDIRSEAFIRVFQQADHYDPDKGSPEAWAHTVMYRSIINSLRRFIPDKTKPAHVWRTNLHKARSIRTSVEQTGRWGESVTVVEPDMVDESAVCPRATTTWDDFIGQLNRDQRIVATERARGCTLVNIRARYFARRAYSYVHKQARDIQQLWKEYVL